MELGARDAVFEAPNEWFALRASFDLHDDVLVVNAVLCCWENAIFKFCTFYIFVFSQAKFYLNCIILILYY